jgi:thioesterase domain-containing protein
LASTSTCFDLSVFELFVPLSCGGRVVLVNNALAVPELSAHDRVTLINTVPSAMAELVRQHALPTSVEVINLAGEALTRSLVEAVYEELPGCAVYNLYGPSEDTTYSTGALLAPGQTTTPLIGRAVANTQAYILDRQLQLVPAGVSGELYLSGAGLARGYLERAELTAERFVPNPYARTAGERMYRTGDLVRWTAAGELDYQGRLDQQVKVRGFRIELGEIEARLKEHEGVREAVVIVRGEDGDKRLVAYVVAAESATLQVVELRSYLSERLPEYMVPAAFVMLAELPLTANGKVNRKALPTSETLREGYELDHIAPRDLVELKLAQIWEEVLNLRPIGMRDNFFELGGHSLLAVQLMARIEKVMQRKLPLSVLFQRPTVEHLAGLLRKGDGDLSAHSSLIPIQPQGTRMPFFCVHAVGGNVMSYVDLARHLGTDQPFYGLQSRGLSGQNAPHRRIEDMASHYIDEIRTIQPEGPYLLGGWSMGGTVAFEMARQLSAQGEDVTMLALIDSTARFDSVAYEEDNLTLLTHFAGDMGVPISQLELSLTELLHMDPEQQLSFLLSEAKTAGLVPVEIGFTEIENLFNVFKANLNAVRSYKPQRSSTPITLFRAGDNESDDFSKGWERFAGAGLEVHSVPGDHYSILREPNVGLLAQHLQAHLEQAHESLLETSQCS